MVMKKNIDAMNHPTKVKESIGERIYTIVVYLLLILISATIILPLLHIISGSFSDPMQLLTGNVSFWPKGFTTSMYEKVLKDASIWTGYLNTILYTVLGTLISATIILPLLHIISGSFSDPMQLLTGNVSFWPKGFTTSMYEKVLKDASIWTGYLNTILYTVLGTLISVTLTACAAYPLSRKDLFGRNVFISLFIFTMFFNGGMIPTYLIIQKLGMLNKIWALVLPSAISTYNMIIMRTFFENTIPNELIEAAALDGCNDITTFFRIVLPLSGAVFAVMALFYGVAQWNSWFPALLYIRDRSLYPLQMILREVLIQSDIGNMAGSTGDVEVIGDGLKYATMVVSTLPIMCLYPFLQKYFVAGVTIGAVKG